VEFEVLKYLPSFPCCPLSEKHLKTEQTARVSGYTFLLFLYLIYAALDHPYLILAGILSIKQECYHAFIGWMEGTVIDSLFEFNSKIIFHT